MWGRGDEGGNARGWGGVGERPCCRLRLSLSSTGAEKLFIDCELVAPPCAEETQRVEEPDASGTTVSHVRRGATVAATRQTGRGGRGQGRDSRGRGPRDGARRGASAAQGHPRRERMRAKARPRRPGRADPASGGGWRTRDRRHTRDGRHGDVARRGGCGSGHCPPSIQGWILPGRTVLVQENQTQKQKPHN